MLKIITGDLFESTETFLCHQCNCVTTRSAHLAKAVFNKYPYSDVYTDRKIHDVPGTVSLTGTGDQRMVVALFGQYYPGFSRFPNSRKDGGEARLHYFQECLEQLEQLEGDFAFPWRIGCGAAGGDWVRYLKEIKAFSERIDGNITVYRLEGAK